MLQPVEYILQERLPVGPLVMVAVSKPPTACSQVCMMVCTQGRMKGGQRQRGGLFEGCLRGNNLGSKTRKMAQFPGMDMQSVCWILKNGNNGTDLQSPRELARQIQQYFATLKPVFKMPERRPHEPPLHDEDVLALISGHQGFLSKKIGFNGADSKA